MTPLHRRLQRLERSRPRPYPRAGADEVIAALTTPELRMLIDRLKRVRSDQPTTFEQDQVWAMVEDRLRAVGITWR
jgi:hypothetical protein